MIIEFKQSEKVYGIHENIFSLYRFTILPYMWGLMLPSPVSELEAQFETMCESRVNETKQKN